MNYILSISNETERAHRSEERYAVESGAIVKFKKSYGFGLFKPRIVKSGIIINISLCGISAEYIASKAWSSAFTKMSIDTFDQEFLIDDIPCKIIYDYKVDRLRNGFFVRRCGIHYGALSGNHKLQLSNFIKEFAIVPNSTKFYSKNFA